MPETIERRGGGRVPVQVRTARNQHPCNDCPEPIDPGEKYELAVYPPHSVQEYDVDSWLTWRTHYPRHDGHNFLLGCAISAAYREDDRREGPPTPLPAGWLIDEIGWLGQQLGEVPEDPADTANLPKRKEAP